MAYGLVAVLWLVGAHGGVGALLRALAIPVVVLAAAAAGYSAFLFGQAEGRDFWQSPLVLPQLLLAALGAGTASLLFAGVLAGADARALQLLAWIMAASLVGGATLLFAELGSTHTSVDVARTARLITRGHFRHRFWAGVVGAGIVVPLLLVWLAPAAGVAGVVAALLVLAGLWIYEDVWVKAGQSIPLS
jgi:formate-dependent nitrite reductase membrane component NrfD